MRCPCLKKVRKVFKSKFDFEILQPSNSLLVLYHWIGIFIRYLVIHICTEENNNPKHSITAVNDCCLSFMYVKFIP